MRRYLHFICPSDYLESLIQAACEGEHYFFTSLGNSLIFNQELVKEIEALIGSKNIGEVSFILSDDNQIVSDALGKQDYWEVEGIMDFYAQIIREKEHTGELWQTGNHSLLLSSCYLNNKIKELKAALDASLIDQLHIKAKIYKRQEGMFRDVYPDVILKGNMSVN